MSVDRKLQWLERVLLFAGLAAAVVYLCMSIPSVLARVQATHPGAAHADAPEIPEAFMGAAYLHGAAESADGVVLGSIIVPQIHLNAPVVEGVSTVDLRRGVGHVPGSAQAGGLGNMVLAAHRDTIFRPIRSIQKGMDIQVKSAEGTFHYQVDSLQVVAPEQLDVMDIASQPQVTLITCYPFNFIGSAPMRYIVKAHLVSAIPDDPVK